MSTFKRQIDKNSSISFLQTVRAQMWSKGRVIRNVLSQCPFLPPLLNVFFLLSLE